jgi:polysaccharide export outer membrane protein
MGALTAGAMVLSACAGPELAPADAGDFPTPAYRIGPGDNLNIFVWRNPELSVSLPVRPDGRLTVPLIDDVSAAGKTPTQLARDLEEELRKFIQDPIVSVLVVGFQGPFDQQVRVVGEAARPQGIPYREDMSVLDVMITVGGLTEFAAGNDAVIVRQVSGEARSFRVRLDDLVKDGDVSANVEMLPGDVLIIPQSWF